MDTKDIVPVILLINGPNLNMLGKRSKEHYGSFTLADVEEAFRKKAAELGVKPVFFQSNEEGGIVTAIHESMKYASGIVINAGAYTHYSYAILDALLLCGLPVMEVHISNIHKREPFRSVSVIQPACVGQISGLGMDSYLVGLEKLVREYVRKDAAPGAAGENGGAPSEASARGRSAAASAVSAAEAEIGQAAEEKKDDLLSLRSRVSEADGELMRIFNRRMDLIDEIGRLKAQSKAPVYDERREEEVAETARAQADDDMSTRVDSMMKTLMRISREKQYDILMPQDESWTIGRTLRAAGNSLVKLRRAVFAGTNGSYSEQATKKLFPDAAKIQANTFTLACEMVLDGEADVAVLPVENSTAGSVDNVFELLQKKSLYIVRATSIAVDHKLAVLPGTKLSAIRTVASHPQALSQCSEIIHQKRWGTRSSENTAFAAAEVKRRGDRSMAAICSEQAALQNGLDILPVEICNASLNQTRFIAVTKDMIITPDADRMSTLMHLKHRSGALVAALQVFADRGLNLSSIFSRPIQSIPGEYAFFLDFLCPAMGQDALLALYQLSMEMPYVKVLGWYAEV